MALDVCETRLEWEQNPAWSIRDPDGEYVSYDPDQGGLAVLDPTQNLWLLIDPASRTNGSEQWLAYETPNNYFMLEPESGSWRVWNNHEAAWYMLDSVTGTWNLLDTAVRESASDHRDILLHNGRGNFLHAAMALGGVTAGGGVLALLSSAVKGSGGRTQTESLQPAETITPSPEPRMTPTQASENLVSPETTGSDTIDWAHRQDQVSVSMNDSRWSAVGINGTDLMMGQHGALITVYSMLSHALGKDLSPLDVHDTLLAWGGFSDAVGAGILVNRESAEAVLVLTPVWISETYKKVPVPRAQLGLLRHMLRDGHVVMGRVKKDMGGKNDDANEHFVRVHSAYVADDPDPKRADSVTWWYEYTDPETGESVAMPEADFAGKAWSFIAYRGPVSVATERISAEYKALDGIDSNYRPPDVLPFDNYQSGEYPRKMDATFWTNVIRWTDKISWGFRETKPGRELKKYFEANGYIPELMMLVICWVESNGKPNVVNPRSHATGLFQVMPSDGNGAGYMCKNGPCFAGRPTIAELKNPETCLKAALNDLNGKLNAAGDLDTALDNYGNAAKYGDLILELYGIVRGLA